MGHIKSGSGSVFLQHKWQSGIWYPSIFYGDTMNQSTIASTNTLTYFPIVIPRIVSIQALAIEVTSASAGNNIRFGLYSDLNGLPNNLLIDSGSIPTDISGVKSISYSATLSNYLYWGATNATAGIPGRVKNLTAQMVQLIGLTSPSNSNSSHYRRTSSNFGAFAANAPTDNLSIINGNCPVIWFQGA